MKSKLTALAATLFAAVAFSVPATAEIYDDDFLEYLTGSATIDGVTYEVANNKLDDDVITITNGGVISLGSIISLVLVGSLYIVITESSYLVSDSDDSTAAVTGTGSLYVKGDDGIVISFDSDYLADLVAGTATEYTYQIFASTVSVSGSVTVDDSWQNTAGVVSVTYDSSTKTVTVVVPEPGAFGLFAGVAALALTAARRSRKNA